MRDDLSDLHNRMSGEIVRAIIQPTIRAGGDGINILVLLESILVGCMMSVAKEGHEDEVLDALVEGVKKRIKDKRLEFIEPEGHA